MTGAVAQITSPTIGSVLPGSTATFAWTAGSNVQAYWLDVERFMGEVISSPRTLIPRPARR
jgi:hypothetical protein